MAVEQADVFGWRGAIVFALVLTLVPTVLLDRGRANTEEAHCTLKVLAPFVESIFAPNGIWGGAKYNCDHKHFPRSLKVCLQKASGIGFTNVKCDTLKESGAATQVPAPGGFFGVRKSCPIANQQWRTWARASAGPHGPVVRTSAPVNRDC